MSEIASSNGTPLPEPPSKRRKVFSPNASPQYASTDGAKAALPRRRSTHARTKPSRTPSRGTSVDRQDGDDDGTRSYSSRSTTSRSQSRSRSRTRSRSGSRSLRSRTRSRTRSRSSSRRRRSDSESNSRSHSRPRTRSQTRSRSPSSLEAQTQRLRLSPSVAAGDVSQPPRQPVRPHYRPQRTLRGHTGPVSQVRVSPDGQWIASASADGTVRVWEASTGAHLDTLVGHMAGVSCLAWSPDSGTIASGSDDKAIRLWDRVTGRPKMTAKSMGATTATSVASRGRVPSGQAAAGAGMVPAGEALRPMPPLLGHHNYIHCLAFSPKGNILASGSYDEAVFLWDVRAGRLMRSLPAHSDPVSGIDFSPDGTLVVSCSTDGLIRVWDTSTGQCLRTLVHEDNPAVTHVCFSPNGRYVLAFNLDNCVRLWDYVAGSVKKTYQGHANQKFAIGGCFGIVGCSQPLEDDDGGSQEQQQVVFIASASEDGRIVLWDVTSKAIMQRLRGHEGVCFWVDVHGDVMVSAGQDGCVRVYRNANALMRHGENGAESKGPEVALVNGHKEEVVEGNEPESGRDGESEAGGKDAQMEDAPEVRQEDLKSEDT